MARGSFFYGPIPFIKIYSAGALAQVHGVFYFA